MQNGIILYTDGGARNNPGPAGAGAICYEGSKEIFAIKKYLGDRTNNWAEYEAVILALTEAKKRKFVKREIEVRSDSLLIVEQISGHWKIKEPALKLQHANVRAILKDFSNIRFTHVPRGENKEADRLVNEAIDETSRD